MALLLPILMGERDATDGRSGEIERGLPVAVTSYLPAEARVTDGDLLEPFGQTMTRVAQHRITQVRRR